MKFNRLVRKHKATMYLDEENILHTTFHNEVHISYGDALEIVAVEHSLRAGQPAFRLYDRRASVDVDDDAGELLDETHGVADYTAQAVISTSLWDVWRSNLYNRLTQRDGNIRFFTSYEKGYDWLLRLKRAG